MAANPQSDPRAGLLEALKESGRNLKADMLDDRAVRFIIDNAIHFAPDRRTVKEMRDQLLGEKNCTAKALLQALGIQNVDVRISSQLDIYKASYDMLQSKLWKEFIAYIGKCGTGSLIFTAGKTSIMITNNVNASPDRGFIHTLPSLGKLADVYWQPWSYVPTRFYNV